MTMSSSDNRTKDAGFGREVGDFDLDLLRITSLGGGESRTSQYTGTKALMLAVLEDAIRSFSVRWARSEEAEFWVRSIRNRSPFSFRRRETLGLSPAQYASRSIACAKRTSRHVARRPEPAERSTHGPARH
jgi:hypothetical protein